MSTTHVGKVVIAERIAPTKEYGSYNDGRYLIHTETENALYGVPLAGYGGVYGLGGYPGDTSLPLTGDGAYRVAAVEEPEQWLLDTLDDVDEDIRAVVAGEKNGQWIISVYHKAQQVSRVLRKVLTEALAYPEPTDMEDHSYVGTQDWMGGQYVCSLKAPELPTIEISVPKGTRVLVSYAE